MLIPEYENYQESKKHGKDSFPYDTYLCTIPKDFHMVPLHWHDEMEMIYIKKEGVLSPWISWIMRFLMGVSSLFFLDNCIPYVLKNYRQWNMKILFFIGSVTVQTNGCLFDIISDAS